MSRLQGKLYVVCHRVRFLDQYYFCYTYLNDVPLKIMGSKIVLFADDTNMLV
jgi:hypothetical protein